MANLKNTNVAENLKLPIGTTAQRPSSPEQAYLRYNTDLQQIEQYNGNNWVTVQGNAYANSTTTSNQYSVNYQGQQYKVFVYNNSGSITIEQSGKIDVLVVAGGGGGGGRSGGGGGAGGVIYKTDHFISAGEYSITVGNGGAPGFGDRNGSNTHGESGGNSTFDIFTAIGGGGGGGYVNASFTDDGGSGGGHPLDGEGVAPSQGLQPLQPGDSGLFGYGNNGGVSPATSGWSSPGGGGGAGGPGQDGVVGGESGHGGPGISIDILGYPIIYGAGGGGGDTGGSNNTGFGLGGNHTGGNGGQDSARSGTTVPARQGAENTGSGGGGGGEVTEAGAAGADGVVVIRIKEDLSEFTNLGRVNSGLQLYLDAAIYNSYRYNGEPNNVWNDLSGYNRNGTLTNNAPFLYNGNEGAIQFERDQDQYVTVPHDADIFEQVFSDRLFATVEGWANVNTFRNWTTIITKATGGSYSNSTGPTLWSYENGFEFVVGKGVSGNPSDGDVQIEYSANENEWYHLVGTVDGRLYGNGTAKFYVDGELYGEENFTLTNLGTVQENTAPITIGKRATGSGPSIDGKIGLVAAYNRPLTAAEVKQNFEADRRRFGK